MERESSRGGAVNHTLQKLRVQQPTGANDTTKLIDLDHVRVNAADPKVPVLRSAQDRPMRAWKASGYAPVQPFLDIMSIGFRS